MTGSELVIDADAHVVEPRDIWLRYLDEPLRELVRRTPGLENGNSTGNDGPESLFPLGFITEMGRRDLLQLAAEPATRLEVMDREGIDRVALFLRIRSGSAECANRCSPLPSFAPTTTGWRNTARPIEKGFWALP